jgi:ribosome maturation factor RimP
MRESFFSDSRARGGSPLKRNEIRNRIEQIAEEVAARHGVSLVDADLVKEAGHEFLRIAIDKAGGVTTQDCEAVSRDLSSVIDDLDLVPWQYTLEVSSPGLERVLRKDREFRHFTGRPIEVLLYAPKDGNKRFAGVLRSFDDGAITVETENGDMVSFVREAVARASLVWKPRR